MTPAFNLCRTNKLLLLTTSCSAAHMAGATSFRNSCSRSHKGVFTLHVSQSRLMLSVGVDYYPFPSQIPCSCILRDMSCCGAATQFWSSCVACLLVIHSLEHRNMSQCTISIFLLATTLTYQQFQVRNVDTSRAIPTWALGYSRVSWQLPAGSHTVFSWPGDYTGNLLWRIEYGGEMPLVCYWHLPSACLLLAHACRFVMPDHEDT